MSREQRSGVRAEVSRDVGIRTKYHMESRGQGYVILESSGILPITLLHLEWGSLFTHIVPVHEPLL